MEQRWINISRNYSRKEGPEMFSLTISRQIESDSTFFRRRAENYIALYDVEIQVLEEMILLDYVTRDFLSQRKRGIAGQLKALVEKLVQEIENGELTKSQVDMNEFTIEEVYARVGNLLGNLRDYTPKYKEDVNTGEISSVSNVNNEQDNNSIADTFLD